MNNLYERKPATQVTEPSCRSPDGSGSPLTSYQIDIGDEKNIIKLEAALLEWERELIPSLRWHHRVEILQYENQSSARTHVLDTRSVALRMR